jgi:redox-regulated HSP33 family molecular chaperone
MGEDEEAKIQTKGLRNPFNEIIAENFSNLVKDMDTYVQEAFQTPSRLDWKRLSPHHD